jgi:hypothetical protein
MRTSAPSHTLFNQRTEPSLSVSQPIIELADLASLHRPVVTLIRAPRTIKPEIQAEITCYPCVSLRDPKQRYYSAVGLRMKAGKAGLLNKLIGVVLPDSKALILIPSLDNLPHREAVVSTLKQMNAPTTSSNELNTNMLNMYLDVINRLQVTNDVDILSNFYIGEQSFPFTLSRLEFPAELMEEQDLVSTFILLPLICYEQSDGSAIYLRSVGAVTRCGLNRYDPKIIRLREQTHGPKVKISNLDIQCYTIPDYISTQDIELLARTICSQLQDSKFPEYLGFVIPKQQAIMIVPGGKNIDQFIYPNLRTNYSQVSRLERMVMSLGCALTYVINSRDDDLVMTGEKARAISAQYTTTSSPLARVIPLPAPYPEGIKRMEALIGFTPHSQLVDLSKYARWLEPLVHSLPDQVTTSFSRPVAKATGRSAKGKPGAKRKALGADSMSFRNISSWRNSQEERNSPLIARQRRVKAKPDQNQLNTEALEHPRFVGFNDHQIRCFDLRSPKQGDLKSIAAIICKNCESIFALRFRQDELILFPPMNDMDIGLTKDHLPERSQLVLDFLTGLKTKAEQGRLNQSGGFKQLRSTTRKLYRLKLGDWRIGFQPLGLRHIAGLPKEVRIVFGITGADRRTNTTYNSDEPLLDYKWN